MAGSGSKSESKVAPSLGQTAKLRPFLAPVLLTGMADITGPALLEVVANEIADRINAARGSDRTLLKRFDSAEGGLKVHGIAYYRESRPPWAPESTLTDRVHELIAVAVKGRHVAVCASEAPLRDWIATRLKSARTVPIDTIERAFVGSGATAMWLRGVHTPTSSKPTAKSLIGPALEDALDPLGDQTFFYSAVRTTVPIKQKNAKGDSAVGAAPASARIWLNRPGDWESFCYDLEKVMDRAAAPPKRTERYPALAQRLPDLAGVKRANAIAVVPLELLSDTDEQLRDLAQQWAYGAEFDVTRTNGPSLEADVTMEGTKIGRVALDVTFSERVKIEARWLTAPSAAAARQAEFVGVVVERDWLKIYYQGGITVAGKNAYRTAWRDQPFDWTFVDLTGYEVKEEKPTLHGGMDLSQCIGTTKADGTLDNSLFGFVVRQAFNTGWLASDDGSMELADFIHVDPATRTVTLIHAKASKSKAAARRASVSQYEVVVGQAVKNLRHLDRMVLAERLEAGKDKKIARAVWHDGTRMNDRSGLIAAVGALGEGYTRRVIVFQPQLTQREWNACAGPQRSATGDRLIRVRQLDTLMLSARLSARAVGGDLIGWADGSP